MSRVPYTSEQIKKLNLIETDKGFVKASSLVAKPKDVEKIVSMQFVAKGQSAPTAIGNRKVKNATKIEENGVKFDSLLEKHMYDLLKGAQIDFQFQKQYILQEKFRYRTEAIRAITLTVDFVLPKYNMIVDTKGHQTHDNVLRWKMLKWMIVDYFEYPEPPEIIMPKNKKECDVLLNRLLFG